MTIIVECYRKIYLLISEELVLLSGLIILLFVVRLELSMWYLRWMINNILTKILNIQSIIISTRYSICLSICNENFLVSSSTCCILLSSLKLALFVFLLFLPNFLFDFRLEFLLDILLGFIVLSDRAYLKIGVVIIIFFVAIILDDCHCYCLRYCLLFC